MRTAQFIVFATLLGLLLVSRVASATPSAQTSAPMPIPTSVIPPVAVPTVISVSSSPPIGAVESSGTLPVGETPLSVAQRVSSESAIPGSQVRYTIQIASSRSGATIETQSLLPAQLQLIGASISGGNCNTTQAVVCWTTIGQSGSATIEIIAQVLPDAAIGSTIVSQTLAQDDLSYTAASDQTAVTIIASPATQNSKAVATKPAQPAQAAQAAKPTQPARAPQPAPNNRSIRTTPDALPAVAPTLPATDPETFPPSDRSAPAQDAHSPNAIPEVSGQNDQRVVRPGR